MSYCRTGPDSDVYAYRSTDRYSIHIAGNRYKQNAHCEIMYDCPEKPIFELASPRRGIVVGSLLVERHII